MDFLDRVGAGSGTSKVNLQKKKSDATEWSTISVLICDGDAMWHIEE